MRVKLLFYFMLGNIALRAQPLNHDSLWKSWNNKHASDSVRWSSIHHLAQDMLYTNPDSTLALAQIELKFAISCKQPLWEMAATSSLGSAWFVLNKYPNALKQFQKILRIAEKTDTTKLSISEKRLYYIGLGNAWHNMGNVYLYSSDYKKALTYYEKGLEFRLKNPNHDNISGSYTNLGLANRRLNNKSQALRYFRLSLKHDAANSDKKGMADNLLNIGSVFQDLMQLDSARAYYKKSLPMYVELNDQYGVLNAYLGLGYAAKMGGQLSIATENCTKALQIATGLGDKYNQQFCYQCLYETYHNQKDWEKAYFNFRWWNEIQDSLFGAEKSRELTSLEMQFDYQKKEMADSLMQAEQQKITEIQLSQEKTQRYALYAGVCLLLVFGAFMYNRFRITRKQKSIIEEQKSAVENQKHLVEEKNKEILDSINYAQRLQQAILAPPDEIKKYLPGSFLLYKPKDIVAGDFYFFETTPTHLFIAAADCTGHGVPGAMVSVVCSNALSRCVKEFGLTLPGEILDKTRELVIETFKKSGSEVKDGMDISLCSISFPHQPASGQIPGSRFHNENSSEPGTAIKPVTGTTTLHWAGANNPLWYIVNGEVHEIKANKQPIGFTDDPKPFTTHEITLPPASSVFLFTDGFADQFGGPKGKKFKYSTLQALLREYNDKPFQNLGVILENALNEWKGELEQIDDVCILGMRI